jgi:hypothetical protein
LLQWITRTYNTCCVEKVPDDGKRIHLNLNLLTITIGLDFVCLIHKKILYAVLCEEILKDINIDIYR